MDGEKSIFNLFAIGNVYPVTEKLTNREKRFGGSRDLSVNMFLYKCLVMTEVGKFSFC